MRENIFKLETYSIKALSPVHIGTGIKLGNWDFLEENGKIYVISLDKLIEKLTPSQQEKIVEYMENRKSLKEFLRNENIKINISNISLYKMHLIDNSSRVKNIWEEIKHPEGLYIPASTLKGAIRTAVLYCLLKENENNYKFLIKEFETKQGKKYKDIVLIANGKEKKGVENIEKFLEKEFFGENQSNDIFKFFKVSDSDVKNSFDNLECRKIYVANTTRAKQPEYYEIICDGTEFKNIRISIINEEEIEKFVNPKYHKTLEKIKNWKKCLYEFSEDLIKTELKFWNNDKVSKEIKHVYENYKNKKGFHTLKYISDSFKKEHVLNHLKNIQKENSPEEPVIRIGKLSGYFSHSIGLFLARDNEKPYDIHEFGKIFNSRAKDWLFPLTRRLTLDNQTLGWCKLEVQKEKQKNSTQTNFKETQKPTIENLASMWGAKIRG